MSNSSNMFSHLQNKSDQPQENIFTLSRHCISHVTCVLCTACFVRKKKVPDKKIMRSSLFQKKTVPCFTVSFFGTLFPACGLRDKAGTNSRDEIPRVHNVRSVLAESACVVLVARLVHLIQLLHHLASQCTPSFFNQNVDASQQLIAPSSVVEDFGHRSSVQRSLLAHCPLLKATSFCMFLIAFSFLRSMTPLR